jgi:FkbM family methyltransferase
MKTFLTLLIPPIAFVAAQRLVRAIRARETSHRRVRLKYGEFFLECDSSHHLPGILAVLPDFGRPLADLVLALNVQKPCVIDVGANIGDTALLLARFAPGARVLCIEGDPRFIPDLTLNTSQVTGVTIAQAILADHSSGVRGRFSSSRKHGGTAHVTLDQDGELLQTHTLDDLLGDYPEFSRPDVIKIDTDGFDPAILRGAAKILETVRPVAFYEWDPYSYRIAGENDFSHAEFLVGLGYDQFLIFTNRGQPLLLVGKPGREVWESLAYFSRSRRSIDGWHYDIAAFPSERQDCCERLWQHYAERKSPGESGGGKIALLASFFGRDLGSILPCVTWIY